MLMRSMRLLCLRRYGRYKKNGVFIFKHASSGVYPEHSPVTEPEENEKQNGGRRNQETVQRTSPPRGQARIIFMRKERLMGRHPKI
jgi:hypothetical protein